METELKGAQFTGPTDGKFVRMTNKLTPAKRADYWKEYVERWQIVEVCHCGEKLIREERTAHRLKHFTPRQRPVATMLADEGTLPKADRLAILRAFCGACGALEGVEAHEGH